MPGIVGDADDQSANRADVGQRHERVRGDVQPHVLHRDDRTRARQRGAGSDLQRDLLVRRPLAVDVFLVRARGLEDFRGRSSGVARGHGDAGFPGPAGNRLVP